VGAMFLAGQGVEVITVEPTAGKIAAAVADD
jgi:hypothetical protein